MSLPAWQHYFTNARILYADDANPSENTSMRVFDQRSVEDVHRLMNEIGNMDIIIDDDSDPGNQLSTMIDLTDEEPTVMRQGLGMEMVNTLLGEFV